MVTFPLLNIKTRMFESQSEEGQSERCRMKDRKGLEERIRGTVIGSERKTKSKPSLVEE